MKHRVVIIALIQFGRNAREQAGTSRATAEPWETFSRGPSGENFSIFLNGAFWCTLYF